MPFNAISAGTFQAIAMSFNYGHERTRTRRMGKGTDLLERLINRLPTVDTRKAVIVDINDGRSGLAAYW